MRRITIKKLQEQIETLKTKNKDLKSTTETEISRLEEEIKDLTEENEEKQGLLDEREIKLLAQAYEDQENAYKKDAKKWAMGLLVSGIMLLASVSLSIYLSQGKIWYERIEFFLIDLIFISAVWFCAAQYSYYIKLRTDFSNRKTLAQAYHNILNNVEDAPIKAKFIEKATDVLCAKIEIETKENLPAGRVLKIIENLSK